MAGETSSEMVSEQPRWPQKRGSLRMHRANPCKPDVFVSFREQTCLSSQLEV